MIMMRNKDVSALYEYIAAILVAILVVHQCHSAVALACSKDSDCEPGLICYTGLDNDCDEDCAPDNSLRGKCPGVCLKDVTPASPGLCGGFAGFSCPNGSECYDRKGDTCSPNCGGADCGGICLSTRESDIFATSSRPDLTRDECTEQGGIIVGDIGNGAIHRDDYTCESNLEPPLGTIIFPPGEPFPIEGEVCCGAETVRCPDGQKGIPNTFCGRGPNRVDCKEDEFCNIDPADRYAFCCPNTKCCDPKLGPGGCPDSTGSFNGCWDEGGYCCADGKWYADAGDGSNNCQDNGLEDSQPCDCTDYNCCVHIGGNVFMDKTPNPQRYCSDPTSEKAFPEDSSSASTYEQCKTKKRSVCRECKVDMCENPANTACRNRRRCRRKMRRKMKKCIIQKVKQYRKTCKKPIIRLGIQARRCGIPDCRSTAPGS
mmetsp:Transcript_7272/g.15884  ORF Transcript_7272/g.15884 Transcript_7272/m.15884 type:complete len:429 (+) Transcript_7272:259-1545(+)